MKCLVLMFFMFFNFCVAEDELIHADCIYGSIYHVFDSNTKVYKGYNIQFYFKDHLYESNYLIHSDKCTCGDKWWESD